MTKNKRRRFSADFKAKVALDAISGDASAANQQLWLSRTSPDLFTSLAIGHRPGRRLTSVAIRSMPPTMLPQPCNFGQFRLFSEIVLCMHFWGCALRPYG